MLNQNYTETKAYKIQVGDKITLTGRSSDIAEVFYVDVIGVEVLIETGNDITKIVRSNEIFNVYE